MPLAAAPALVDPTGHSCPTYNGPECEDILEDMMAERRDATGAITRPARSKDDVVTALRSAWQKRHDADVIAWEAHLEAEAEKRADEERETRELAQKRKEELKAELEKKRPKIPDWDSDDDSPAGEGKEPLPPYVERALEKGPGEYLPLWCFLPAAQKLCLNKFGMADIRELELGEGYQISASAATRIPKECVPDEDLTWSEICTGSTRWLKEMLKYGVSEAHVDAWGLLMQKLIYMEEYQSMEGLPPFKPLIIYIAQVRREWHAACRNVGKMFNPSKVKLDRMAAIVQKLDREALQRDRVSENCFLYRKEYILICFVYFIHQRVVTTHPFFYLSIYLSIMTPLRFCTCFNLYLSIQAAYRQEGSAAQSAPYRTSAKHARSDSGPDSAAPRKTKAARVFQSDVTS
jgi:hypothetical protein